MKTEYPVYTPLEEALADIIMYAARWGYMPYNCPDADFDACRLARKKLPELIELMKKENG